MLNLFKALADSTRIRLLRILRQGDFTVQDLMQILDMGQSRISRHLKLLCEAGLLRVEKQGTWHYYRLSPGEGLFSDVWPFIESRLACIEGQEHDSIGVLQVMAERRRRSQDFFDDHARDWDRMHVELLNLPDYQESLVALLPAGGLVVEIGVGTGSLLPFLAQKCEHTVGLDHSPSMVNLARETVAKYRLRDKVEVRLAEMNHLPFAGGTVRTVVMNQVLHHAEQPLEVFREIERVLQREGLLVMADLTRHEYDWTRDRLADQWLGFKQQELEGWLAEVGLKMTSYQELGNSAGQQKVLLLTAGVKHS
ncbi:MAG: metalloregulator ArsR/SmtB family transcription factor [Desulfuromonadales bacterium]|nr:metalloregulator ArsR/SmtB family transcription factor [Desulfuromonadales bacterium]